MATENYAILALVMNIKINFLNWIFHDYCLTGHDLGFRKVT